MAFCSATVGSPAQHSDRRPAHRLAGDRVSMGMDTHLLVEMWQSPFPTLAEASNIAQALGRTGQPGNELGIASRTDVRVHQFTPYGVSGTASTPDAHILIHTWPENKYAAVDIYARGRNEAYEVLEQMKRELQPECVYVIELRRGQLIEMEDT